MFISFFFAFKNGIYLFAIVSKDNLLNYWCWYFIPISLVNSHHHPPIFVFPLNFQPVGWPLLVHLCYVISSIGSVLDELESRVSFFF